MSCCVRCCLGPDSSLRSPVRAEAGYGLPSLAGQYGGGAGGGGWFRAAEEGREVAAQQTRYWRLGGWSYSSSIPKSYYCENGTNNRSHL